MATAIGGTFSNNLGTGLYNMYFAIGINSTFHILRNTAKFLFDGFTSLHHNKRSNQAK